MIVFFFSPNNSSLFKYSTNDADWVNKETRECVSGYTNPPELEYLLSDEVNFSS